MDFSNLQSQAFEISYDKGFWPEPATDREYMLHMATKIGLIGTEVTEAMEAWRTSHNEETPSLNEALREAELAEELADIVIRTMDIAEAFTFNLDWIIQSKLDKNRDRPVLHGKRF